MFDILVLIIVEIIVKILTIIMIILIKYEYQNTKSTGLQCTFAIRILREGALDIFGSCPYVKYKHIFKNIYYEC